MDKISYLRRNLLLQLIVYECNIFGDFKFLDVLFVGKCSVVDYCKLFGECDLNEEKLAIIHSVTIDITNRLRGCLVLENLSGVTILRQDETTSLIADAFVGEFLFKNQLSPVPSIFEKKGIFKADVSFKGVLTKDPPKRYCIGREWFYIAFPGFAIVDNINPSIGFLSDKLCFLRSTPYVDNVLNALGTSIIQELFLTPIHTTQGEGFFGAFSCLESFLSEAKNLEGNFLSSRFDPEENWSGFLRKNRRLVYNHSNKPWNDEVIVYTGYSEPRETKPFYGELLQKDPQFKGFIELGKERLVFGVFDIQGLGVLTKPSYRAEGNGLLLLNRTYPMGEPISLGLPLLANGALAKLDFCINENLRGYPTNDDSFGIQNFFLLKDKPLALITKKLEDQLLPFSRSYEFSAFSISSNPSYWDMLGMYGRLLIDNKVSIEHKHELHKTLEYEVVPDFENGGNTYEITSKYYRESNNIFEIGWRYVGHLIID